MSPSTGSPPVRDRIVVFVGPSLPSADRLTDARFLWRPPAQAGDTVLLREARPRAVLLLDGVFDSVPAVRHKELLSLLATGTPVIGAASMGALRAAELHRFGMIGVGHVFQAYASGRIEADDEVALLHGPEDFDFAPLTEALVNVRATLRAAARARVIAVEDARAARDLARGLFYKRRTWPTILDAMRSAGLGASADRLETWLPAGRVDLKRLDALAAIERAASVGPADAPPPFDPVETVFSRRLDARVRARAKGLTASRPALTSGRE